METMRTVDIQELRARVARAEYTVDAEAVAEAIVRRVLPSEHNRPYDTAMAPTPSPLLAVDDGAGATAA